MKSPVLVLPETTLEEAHVRAETIRAAVENLQVVCPGDTRVGVTISLGVVVFPEHGGDAETLVLAADQAMYAAKAAGRNCVRLAQVRAAAV